MGEAIRAVILTMFGDGNPPEAGETSAVRGARSMEPVSGVPFPVYRSGDVILLQAGVGPANTAAAVTTFVHDPRWDLREARWVVAGIAGIDPAAGSLGSVCLCDHVVDGDLAFEFVGADIPSEWSTGIVPLGGKRPFDPAARDHHLVEGVAGPFDLRGPAREEARKRLAQVDWEQEDAAARQSVPYAEREGQGQAVFVEGSICSAARFWHGERANRWARDWVTYWTRGAGRFTVASMEDAGTLVALWRAAEAGWVKPDPVVILRAASNFTVPPPDVEAVTSLIGASEDYAAPGMALALRNLVRAVRALLD